MRQRNRVCVIDHHLHQNDGSASITVGSPAWYAWLNDEHTTSFVYRSARGGFTARRERQRNGWYWYAYRRIGGKLCKRYLGRAGDLTNERLQQVDAAFAAGAGNHAPRRATIFSRAQSLPAMSRLRVPPSRPLVIERPRLIERLDATLTVALTLISAPAGFGKTTLLTTWVAYLQQRAVASLQSPGMDGSTSCTNPHDPTGGSAQPTFQTSWTAHPPASATTSIAWVSLDQMDNDPVHFWSMAALALNAIRPDAGRRTQALLESPQPPPHTLLAHSLLADLNDFSGHVVLVFDDYHLITSEAVHESLITCIDHLPAHVHLVIATRVDPPLPLARWRVRGLLAELRSADLRFTTEEATAFLRSTMGLDLPLDAIRTLEERTEGWAAALQLAALSIRDRADSEMFIRRFAGSHRAIVDYLAEEVINRLPEHVQTFLLYTSVLDRMSAELCAALLDPSNGVTDSNPAAAQAMLDYLERANLFVVPLDEERRWYRYHHLFAGMLRDWLERTQPALVADLHRRAARWYREAGFADAAIRHLVQAGDADGAAEVIEASANETLWEQGDAQTLLRWIAALPDETVLSRPRLALDQVWAFLASIQFDAAEARASEIEHTLMRHDAHTQSLIVGELAAMRSVAARVRGDVPRALEYATRALDLLGADDRSLARTLVVMNLVEAHLMHGDLIQAQRAAAELHTAPLSRNLIIALIGFLTQSGLYRDQGRLAEARALLDEAIRLIERRGAPERPIVAMIHLALAEIAYEQDALDEAEQYAQLALKRAERWWNNDILINSLGLLSAIQRACGNESAAVELAEQVERLTLEYRIGWISNRVLAGRAERLLRTGDRQAAERWASTCGLSLEDTPPPERFYEYLVLARVALARGEGRASLPLIRQLLEQSDQGGHITRMIDALKLLALARRQIGDSAGARQALLRALRLAEPGKLVHTFVDEGEPMKWLLADCGAAIAPFAAQGDPAERRLLMFIDHLIGRLRPIAAQTTAQTTEPLSVRELQVLRLIAAGHTDQEIAAILVIAVSTVRSHVRRVYAKINARNRTQAVIRARDLGIID